MKNILIADSGSTKTDWAFMTDNGAQMIATQGISPYFLNTEQIKILLQQELLINITDPSIITEVHYYGTGCTASGTISVVANALTELFPRASVKVTYDLVAAAHALCGHDKGIVCILGTGSNSCYWNGEKIDKNNPGLGYILGDEGSGAHLGKLIIAAYLYRKLPGELQQLFETRFDMNHDLLLTKVYSTSLPGRFLASFSVFFAEHRGHPALEKLLHEGLDDFFRKHIMTYPESKTVPVHFTGSIAWAYRDLLLELGENYGFQIGKIVKEPMKDLMDFHMEKSFVL